MRRCFLFLDKESADIDGFTCHYTSSINRSLLAESPPVIGRNFSVEKLADKKALNPDNLQRLHCIFCGFQCGLHQKPVFSAHFSSHDSGKNGLSCFHCCKEFRSSYHLNAHISVHSHLYHFICSKCSIAFATNEFLSAHCLQTHYNTESHTVYNSPSTSKASSLPTFQNAKHFDSSTLPNSNFSFQYCDSTTSFANLQATTQSDSSPIKTSHSRKSYSYDNKSFSSLRDSRLKESSYDGTFEDERKLLKLPKGEFSSYKPSPTGACKTECSTSSIDASVVSSSSAKSRLSSSSLADYISNDLAKALADFSKEHTPSLSDVMFMQAPTSPVAEPKQESLPDSNRKTKKNLRNLMEELVEERIYAGIYGKPMNKPDLNFTVTFSDDEENDITCNTENIAKLRSS